jgi:hypothetical protein
VSSYPPSPYSLRLPLPRAFWDVGETLTIKPLTPDKLMTLLQRWLGWKCPHHDRKQHWSFRVLPQFLAMVQGPAIARKRWEALNPLDWEALLRSWILQSFSPVTTDEPPDLTSSTPENPPENPATGTTESADELAKAEADESIASLANWLTNWLVRAMARTWHLKTLAEWDMQLIAATLPIVPESVMTPLWEPVRLKKRLQLFQLNADWLTTYPDEETWPFAYWCARLTPWTRMGALWWPVIRHYFKPNTPNNSLLKHYLIDCIAFNSPAKQASSLLPEDPQACMTAQHHQQSLQQQACQPLLQEARLYPQQVLVLVEGQTEQRLLPLLAESFGLQRNDWWCWPVGGKNQMLGTYECARQALDIPIIILLDADAAPIYQRLNAILRPSDHICLLAHGELEDHLPLPLLVNALNAAYPLHPLLTEQDFAITATATPPACRVDQLRQLWRDRQMGVFDKTTLAMVLSDYLAQCNSFIRRK